MTLMEREIFEQPVTLQSCADYNSAIIKEICSYVKTAGIKNITLAARGSSSNAATYFKYICEIYAGVPVGFAAPSAITLYGGKVNFKNTLLIGVSQSGRAADVLACMERAKASGTKTVAITNNADSPMAHAADFHIDLCCGEEKSVAATKTFTAQMYALAHLAAELSADAEFSNQLKLAPALVAEVLKMKDKISDCAARYKDAPDCYLLARGINYAVALEAALKVQETTYTKAKAYAISDFHHGPFAVLDSDSRAIIIAHSGAAIGDAMEMALKIKKTGCDLTVISDDKSFEPLSDAYIQVPASPESVSPFVYAVTAQLFALSLAVTRGLNPDAPRGLSKITITR